MCVCCVFSAAASLVFLCTTTTCLWAPALSHAFLMLDTLGHFSRRGVGVGGGGDGGSGVGQTVGPSMRERGGAWALPQRVKR